MRAARMELLKTLVSERLSAAAQEIFSIVERTLIEYEEEMWASDRDDRRLHVHAAGVQLQPVSTDVGVCLYPEDCPEPAEDRPKGNSIHPHPPAVFENHHGRDQEVLMDGDDDGVKQECDMEMTLDHHDTQTLFRCPVCSCGFSSRRTMVQHFGRHQEDESSSYQCQFCPSSFLHKPEFILHIRSHQGDDVEVSHHQRDCGLVQRQELSQEKPSPSLSRSDLRTVHMSSLPRDRYRCHQESVQLLCMHQTQTVGDTGRDPADATPVKPVKTEPADPQVHSAPDYRFPSSPYQGERDGSKLLLKNILHEAPSGKPPPILVIRSETQKAHRCPVCSKSFSLRKTLIRHLKMHSADKAYRCQLCGRQFCQKSDLANHTRIHTGERPHQCPSCPKAFVQRGNLNVHMRTHAAEKANQRTALEFHVQQHTS